MPDISIDPGTQRQLRAFGRRRRLFAGVRGGLVAAAMLLVVFFLIALIDWLTVMPNGVRWSLTIAGYITGAAAAWFLGLRDFTRPATDSELARCMETAAPELREELLSAVELADFDPETLRDSLEFRRLVQKSVAEQVAHVEPERLLPWTRLKNWAVAAGSGLALVATLALIVGFGFASRLMMRAAVPGVNIARITGVEITIIEPAPASLITRAGDPVTLRFRVSKPEVRVADLTLETEGRTRTVQLRPIESGIFETTLHPNRSAIDYSLAAGDAVTSVQKIDPHTPPVILDFNKRYVFPDYVEREPQDIRERDGHLKAIEGTTVRLEIATDQPSVGEIRLTIGGETKAIPLRSDRRNTVASESSAEIEPSAQNERSADWRHVLAAEIPLTDSGRYQIHLVGARSKLPAEFAPTYQITAHPDKAPRIRLIQPDTESVVQPDAVISVQAQAEDDIGIARVEQWLSRNGGEDWEKFPIASKPGRQTPISFNWDLLKHHLDAGDLITTKLVAFDGRGEIAESREVDLTINFRDLDAERLTGLRARERAFTIFDELCENSTKTLDGIRDGLKNDSADRSKLFELDREAWSALGRLRTPLQTVPVGRDAYDLNLAARSAALGRHLGIRQAIRRAPFARSLRDPEARAAHFQATSSNASESLRRYSTGRELVRAMIAEELPRIALGDFLDLRRQTELLLPEERRSDGNADELRRFGRVLGLTLHRASSITELLGEFEVSWRNAHAEKLHQVAETVGPRLEGLSLDLDTLRADDRKSRSAINQLGQWWQLGAIPFVDFDEAYHHKFPPELAIDLRETVDGQRWSRVSDWEEGAVRELAQPSTVVYLFRTLTASSENVVEVEIACREGISIWLNGEVWVQNHNQRSNQAERYRMQLQPGQNNLLVKLINRRHPHPFSFRIENSRLEGDVDELASRADKLRFLARETKSVLDDAIQTLQPVLVQMSEFTARNRADNEREAGETRSLAAVLHRHVARSIYYGIDQEKGKEFGPRDRDFLDEVPQVHWTPYTDALDSFAWLDEIRPNADSAFCRSTGVLARALESMRPEFIATAKATPADFPDETRNSPQTTARQKLESRIRTLSESFQLLESACEIREIERAVRELAAQEEWRSQGPEPRTRHPFEWQFIVQRLEFVGLNLSQGGDAIDAGTALLDVLNGPAAKQVSSQMDRRLSTLEPLSNLRPQLGNIRAGLRTIVEQMKSQESEAFAAIQAEAPTLTELMATTAEAARKLETNTRQAVVEIADADETVAFARTRQLFLNQQQNDRLVRNVMNALRQDANSQNVLVAAGRERSRDTDAALEWLRLPAKLSAAAYEDAVFAETPREQRHLLEDGGLNQGTIANRLDALMQHFQALDASTDRLQAVNAEQQSKDETPVVAEPTAQIEPSAVRRPQLHDVAKSRDVLRGLELEFEIRERLDREYSQLERVADMAGLRQTANLITALEGELAGNGAMRRELDSLTRNATQDSLTDLQLAATAEATIRKRLKDEAVRQGEFQSAMTKTEVRTARALAESEVARLRQSATNLRESYLSLRAQYLQLHQRHEQFTRARTDFLEIELPAINVAAIARPRTASRPPSSSNVPSPASDAPPPGDGDNDLAKAVEVLSQANDAAQKKLLAANSDLAKLDFTDELTALKSAVTTQRATIADVPSIPTVANSPLHDSIRLLDSALKRFPTTHAGDLRVASHLYQCSNEIRNAAARLEAASEAELNADRQVIAAVTRLTGKPHEDLTTLVGQFRELVNSRMPTTIQTASRIGATDAAINYTQATKDAAAALALAPNPDADLLSLSQCLDQLGLHLRDAGTEMIRGTRAIHIQIETPARIAHNKAAQMMDRIRRIENQARQQLAIQTRAMNAMKPRGGNTLPEEEMKQKQQEADEAEKRATDLTRQADRMAADHEGNVEKTKAFLSEVSGTITASNEVGRQAQTIGDQFRKLSDHVEAQVAALQPRNDSAAGRAAEQYAKQVAAVNNLAERIEKLALRINPNVHTPSELEVAARQADEAHQKATDLLVEEAELRTGPHPDDVLPQITEAQRADAEARNLLSQAEQKLRELQELEALPEPDPNPQRAKSAILAAADDQAQVISQVAAASRSLLGAALHEQRLGHRVNATELGRLAKRVHSLADSGLPTAANLMRAAKNVLATAEATANAEESIRAEMDALRKLLFPEANVAAVGSPRTDAGQLPSTDGGDVLPSDQSEREAEVSQQLARVLFQVQKQLPGETLLARLELSGHGIQSKVNQDFEETEQTPQPETTRTQPDNAPTKPEATPTQPDNAPAKPEPTPTQPDTAPAQPENAPAPLENAPGEPLDADALPEAAVAEALPVNPELAEALAEVAAAQAQALNAERNQAIDALPAVELDETVIERDSFSDDLDRLANLRDRNWNAFREEGEQELSLGNEKKIDGIYRDAIEAYFRVISRATKVKPVINANER